MLLYLAGPMSGHPLFNFPAFDAARDELTAMGHRVLSPADLDRKVGFDPATSTVDKQFLDAAMARDVLAIQMVDGIVMLPGWQQSTGATAEYHLARWRHIPIFQWPSMEWILEDGEGPFFPEDSGSSESSTSTPTSSVPTISGKDPKAEAGSKKCPLHLLPPHSLRETAWVHNLGSKKYGPFNWRKTGVSTSTYVAAIMRHLLAIHDGEWLDPESQHPHAAHIAASANILIDSHHHNKLDQ